MLLPMLTGIVGCGPQTDRSPTAPVQGKISYQDKPLERGTVVFFPKSGGKTATGTIQPDGSYTLSTYSQGDGALLGEHNVTVISERDMSNVLPEDPEASLEPSLIPTKYNLQKTSGLTANVQEGDNQIDFELTD